MSAPSGKCHSHVIAGLIGIGILHTAGPNLLAQDSGGWVSATSVTTLEVHRDYQQVRLSGNVGRAGGNQSAVFTSGSSNWKTGFALPGPNLFVNAVAADERFVYVGGFFSAAGDVRVDNLAKWDRMTGRWSPLGGGVTLGVEGTINEVVAGDGRVVVRGNFALPDSEQAVQVVSWDGGAWSGLDAGLGSGRVSSLTYSRDTLYALGTVSLATLTFHGILKWDGMQWNPVGPTLTGSLHDVGISESREFFVAGALNDNGVTRGLARWDTQNLSFLDSEISLDGVMEPRVNALVIHRDTVYVVGFFDEIGGVAAKRVARWAGGVWEPLAQGVNDWLTEAVADHEGNLYTGTGGQRPLQRWDGNEWSDWGPPLQFGVAALESYEDELFVGGLSPYNEFIAPAAVPLYWYDGERWALMGDEATNGIGGSVVALVRTQDDDILAGGDFGFAGITPANNIARWAGSGWEPLGEGTDGPVFALARGDGGAIYAGGLFRTAGGGTADYIAAWDGAKWSSLAQGVNAPVEAIIVRDGSVYVGGAFTEACSVTGCIEARHVARWDGTDWHALGGGTSGPVLALALSEDGSKLYAGGLFTEVASGPAGGVAQWDGSEWSPLGSGFTRPVWTIAVGDGQLYAGGNFSEDFGDAGNGIARWDGVSWQPLGDGMGGPNLDVEVIDFSDSGLLFAAGWFFSAGGTPARRVAWWDGEFWHPLDGGVMDYPVTALVVRGRDVFVGGRFYSVDAPITQGGVIAVNFAQWTMPEDLETDLLPERTSNRPTLTLYPNPSAGATTIDYSLPAAGPVRLEVYDLLGRRVISVVNQIQPPGHYQVTLSHALASGVYQCRLSADGVNITRSLHVAR